MIIELDLFVSIGMALLGVNLVIYLFVKIKNTLEHL